LGVPLNLSGHSVKTAVVVFGSVRRERTRRLSLLGTSASTSSQGKQACSSMFHKGFPPSKDTYEQKKHRRLASIAVPENIIMRTGGK
jgi:hypothetical protein